VLFRSVVVTFSYLPYRGTAISPPIVSDGPDIAEVASQLVGN
jgi:hypothetical protein